MVPYSAYLVKGKCLISISIALLLISLGTNLTPITNKAISYNISYEYVNIKDMATAQITTKQETSNVLGSLINKPKTSGKVEEVSLPQKDPIKEITPPEKNWYLPVNNGTITTSPNYYHVALDITSQEGSNTDIYPIANGVISGIYTDNAGAKIITIRHNIEGKSYTSQYVHLATYASNIQLGQEVTVNDPIGKMGATGIATGVHLHIAVIDCALFDEQDGNCKDLNSFFQYAKQRYNQGFSGLNSLMEVPNSWNSR